MARAVLFIRAPKWKYPFLASVKPWVQFLASDTHMQKWKEAQISVD